MNICFFIRDLKIEGVQVVTVRLAQEIAKHGHSVTILTLTDERDLPVSSLVNVESLAFNKKVSRINFKASRRKFLGWLTEKESLSVFDVVIASHGETILQ